MCNIVFAWINMDDYTNNPPPPGTAHDKIPNSWWIYSTTKYVFYSELVKPLYHSKQEERNSKCWENVIHLNQEIGVIFLLPELKSTDKNAVFLLLVSGTKLSSPSDWMVTPSSISVSSIIGLRVFLFVDDLRKIGGSLHKDTKLRVGSDFLIPDLEFSND